MFKKNCVLFAWSAVAFAACASEILDKRGKDFVAQLFRDENNHTQRTWKWFDEYFSECGFTGPLKIEMIKFAKTQQERIQLAKKGILFTEDGRTVLK